MASSVKTNFKLTMNTDYKMPEAYLRHKVFDDLEYMRVFYLTPHYLMASDYMDYNKVIKPHVAIANFIFSTCYLKIQRQS